MSTPQPPFGPGADDPRSAQPGQAPYGSPAPYGGQPQHPGQPSPYPGQASPYPGQASPYPAYAQAAPQQGWAQPGGPGAGGPWQTESPKSFVVAWLLSLFLGAFGADRFYRGFIGLGVLKLLTCGGLGVWALIDLIILLATGGTDAQGRKLAQYESNKKVAWIVSAVVVALGLVFGGVNSAGGSSDVGAAPDEVAESAPAQAVADAPAATTEPAAAAAAPTTEAPAPAATEAPAPEVALPATQVSFRDAVATARTDAKTADTDLQRANVLNVRSDAMCTSVPDGKVEKWIGTVETVDANGEGKAVVKLTIDDDIEIGTWNNAVSDYADNTLIEQGTPLFDQALALSPGDTVEFSATLKSGDESNDRCYYTSNMTEAMSIDSPDYIVNFTELTKVE